MNNPISKDFINYWDDTIRLWLAGGSDPHQRLFLDKSDLRLSEEDMPEPYWGDPEHCSFVIVNYNPGGGFNRDRHTYRDCAGCPKNIVTYVQQMGYSSLAKQFPLLMSEEELRRKGVSWVTEYSGWSWWQKKRQWIEQIVSVAAESEDTKLEKPPFVFELCAWHSPTFNEKCKDVLIGNDNLREQFCRTLREAVRHSDMKLAVLVGAKFYGFLEKLGFQHGNMPDEVKGCRRRFQLYNIGNTPSEEGRIIVTWCPHSRNRYQQFSGEDLKVLKAILQ